jgi:large subunit ribosomal protein L24e
MAGNPAKNLREGAADIERHIELVQPRRSTTTSDVPTLAEKEKIREKLKVRAAGKKIMAAQLKSEKGAKGKRESKLIPASGGSGMGMGMNVD